MSIDEILDASNVTMDEAQNAFDTLEAAYDVLNELEPEINAIIDLFQEVYDLNASSTVNMGNIFCGDDEALDLLEDVNWFLNNGGGEGKSR